jgi:hypothetical protein
MKLTRSGTLRNWNALPGARVIFETVEKVRPAPDFSRFHVRRRPVTLYRGFASTINPAGFIDFLKFLPILQCIRAGGQFGLPGLGAVDAPLFRSVLRPK